MAEHELSILVRAKGALQAARDIGKVDTAAGRLGQTAGRGLRTAARNTALIGAGIAVGVAAGVRSGIQSLADLEDATTAVTGALVTAGHQGEVTAAQVATWANDIERDIGAAFDDKDIVSATATLIRFGKVTPANLRPAMEVMTDLAVKTGSVESASTLLAKALADPEKAAGKLARAGVVLTKEQQKQIKAMVKAGDTAGAQALILDTLAKSTEGAAAASQGPYRRSLAVLADVTEDAQRALGEGFLPVITKVADLLQGELAKPSTIANIREFGKNLASGLDNLISIAKSLPWGAIGTSLQVAGTGAKTILTAFAGLPPWVQTAVLTSWGLNKLTGGALGSIVGQLGSGLIKGILGMNAGVVNINAGVVNGGGGVPGVPGGKGGGGSILGKIGGAILPVTIAAIAAGVAFEVVGLNDPKHRTSDGRPMRGTNDRNEQLVNIDNNIRALKERAATDPVARRQLAEQQALKARLLAGESSRKVDATTALAQQRKGEQTALSSSQRWLAAYNAKSQRTNTLLGDVGLKAQRAGERAAGAIKAKDLSVRVANNVSVRATLSTRDSTASARTYSNAIRHL